MCVCVCSYDESSIRKTPLQLCSDNQLMCGDNQLMCGGK